jgi:hypothetical protein
VTQAAVGGRPVSRIAFARYEFTVDSQVEPERAIELFTTSAVVQKRTKKKDFVPTDIVPFIREFTPGYSAVITAKDPVLNPEYIAEAWRTYLDPEAAFSFRRTELLDGEGKRFDNLI